jgi:hypothetical protein
MEHKFFEQNKDVMVKESIIEPLGKVEMKDMKDDDIEELDKDEKP